ncbi:MAG: ABC transporter ATP-binding protein/permease, partial [Pseudomonadota bacterium]
MANFKILLSILPLRLFAPVLWPLLGILLLDLVMFAALRGFFLMLTDLDLAQGTLPFSLVPALLLGNAEQALLICGGITLVIALARGFLAFRLWQSAFLRVALVQAGVSKDLFQRYMLQDYVSIRAASVSEQKLLLMHAISLTGQLMMPMTVLIIEGAVALVITLYLFVWDPLPALVLLLWMALLFAASGQLRARQSKEIGHTRWTALQDTRRHIDTALNDLGSVRITAAETRLTHQFNTATDNHTSAVARETAHAGIERHFLEAGIISLILLIYLALVYDARPPEALLPTLVVFAAACVRVFPFALRAGGYARRLKHSEADLLALKDALDGAKARPVSASPKAKHAPFEDRLTLRDIRFHYPGKRDVTPALTLAHFELPKGARLRITGPSGAGKSTFLALMLGLIDVPEGHALVDGRPQPILPALRGSAVALVPQKPLILPGTVAQNILF